MTTHTKPPWWYWFTREGRLIKRYELLQGDRKTYTPAVSLKEDPEKAIEVLEAPDRLGGDWILFGHRPVRVEEIHKLEDANSMADYD